jgi:hypothetical protein
VRFDEPIEGIFLRGFKGRTNELKVGEKHGNKATLEFILEANKIVFRYPSEL